MAVKRDATDKAFSDAIRESYDYTCCHCGHEYRHDPGYVHCAHVHTRKHRNTRWCSEYGAIALCAKCHRRFTDFPLEWAEFVRSFLGDSNYDEAKRRAWKSRKFTKAEQLEVRKHYQSELKRIQELRKNGETGYIPLISYD